jgi:glycerol-3-phosphate dehydrogenase
MLAADGGATEGDGTMVAGAMLSAAGRREALDEMTRAPLDVLVIGGGITGAGVALDAAARGYRVGLIERGDFAGGTSSRSTKLVHGGIRYLPELDVPLVREALLERGRLLRNAPHLVHPLAFVLPLYASSRHPVGLPIAPPGGIGLGLILDAGLTLYDLLAGRENVARHRRLSAAETEKHAPCLVPDGLKSGFVYYDAQTDDARLTLAVLRTAAGRGALAANYCEAVSFLRDGGGRTVGVVARDTLEAGGEGADGAAGEARTWEIRARHVVNAAGVWSERVERLAGETPQLRVQPSKGTHLVFAKELFGLGDEAIVLPETADRRIIFIVPWLSRALVGTTDDATDSLRPPVATSDEIDYLLAHLNRFTRRPVTRDDILATYAGYRPLLKLQKGRTPARLSRTHAIVEGDDGLLTLSGGKLTTYRRMAEELLDRIDARDGWSGAERRHPTLALPLAGAEGWERARVGIQERAAALGLEGDVAEHLSAYGTDAAALLDLVAGDAALGARLVDDLPYIAAEVVWACRAELALTLEDVLARRTRIAIEERTRGLDAAAMVARLMAVELGWSDAERARQIEAYAGYAREQAGPLADALDAYARP